MTMLRIGLGIAAGLAAFSIAHGVAQPAATPTSRDEVRASKLVGSTIYNEQSEPVGTLDDVLLTHDGKQPVQAIVSVGGFLGIGSKLVTVPYDRLSFQENNKVVMPHASRDDLRAMPGFSYAALDHSGGTNIGAGNAATAVGGTAAIPPPGSYPNTPGDAAGATPPSSPTVSSTGGPTPTTKSTP